MSSAMKSAISLLLLAMVVTENGATVVLPALDPSCPPLTGNLNACVTAENVVAITVATSPVPPQCCQGLQNIVAGNATVNLCQDAICQCFTDFVAARIPTVQASLRVSVLASLQTRCNVNIGVNATACAA